MLFLSESQFERCELALGKAARCEMKVWLYDEDNCIKDSAGRRVLSRNLDFVAQHFTSEQHDFKIGKDLQLTLKQHHRFERFPPAEARSWRSCPPTRLTSGNLAQPHQLWHDQISHSI